MSNKVEFPTPWTEQQAIANGVKLLNKECPGWYLKINTETLNIGYPDLCVLGQVFSDEARKYSFDAGYEFGRDFFCVLRFGRSLSDFGWQVRGRVFSFSRLTTLWRKAVDDLKEAGGVYAV